MPLPDIRAAMLIATIGFAMFACGDAVVKSLAGAWPATAIAALRYTLGALALAAILAAREGRSFFLFPRPLLQLGRGVAIAFATLCFFMALMALPLADATAIQFTSPMLTAILSALVLGERMPRAGWGATALAFAGVLMVLRPNLLALGLPALFPLGSAFGMAWLMILNRKSAGLGSSLAMQLTLAAVAAPLLLIAAAVLHVGGGPAFRIPPPDAAIVGKVLIVTIFATSGHLLVYSATLRASAAVVAPMTYIQLVIALLLGWAWFGSTPDAAMLGGAALIVAGGLWLFRSQRPTEVAQPPD